MKRVFQQLLALFACLPLLSPLMAADKGKMLIAGCGYGEIALIDNEGKAVWSIPFADEVSDAVLLQNGNILHSYKAGGIRELKPDYASGKGAETVWEWKAEPVNGKTGEIHTCQLVDDKTIVTGESHEGVSYIREIDRTTDKVTKSIKLEGLGGAHSTFRQIRKTPSGTYLVTQQRNGGKAIEFDADGNELRTFPSGRFTAIRLPDGNTLIACGDEHRLIEVDKDNKIVWEVAQNDIEGITLGFVAGVQRLPNGNTVITNWGGHGNTSGPAVIEITKEKKAVWSTPAEIKNRVSTVQVTSPESLTKTPLR